MACYHDFKLIAKLNIIKCIIYDNQFIVKRNNLCNTQKLYLTTNTSAHYASFGYNNLYKLNNYYTSFSLCNPSIYKWHYCESYCYHLPLRIEDIIHFEMIEQFAINLPIHYVSIILKPNKPFCFNDNVRL